MEIQVYMILLVLQLILVKLRKNRQNYYKKGLFSYFFIQRYTCYIDIVLFMRREYIGILWNGLSRFLRSLARTINTIKAFGIALIHKESTWKSAFIIYHFRKPNRNE